MKTAFRAVESLLSTWRKPWQRAPESIKGSHRRARWKQRRFRSSFSGLRHYLPASATTPARDEAALKLGSDVPFLLRGGCATPLVKASN